MVMSDAPDHLMEGIEVRATTEFLPQDVPLTLDPSMLQIATSMAIADPSSAQRSEESQNGDNLANGHLSVPISSLDQQDGLSTLRTRPRNKQEISTAVSSRTKSSRVLPYSTSSTGLVYDVRMRFHVEVRPEQNQGVHPEDPRRIYAIYQELVEAGLVLGTDEGLPSEYVLGRIPTRDATKAEICAVHSERHYEWVMGLKGML